MVAGERALFCLAESWRKDVGGIGEDGELFLANEKTKQYWLDRVGNFLRANGFVYVPPDLLRVVREEHARYDSMEPEVRNDPASLVWLGLAGTDYYLAKEVLRQNPEKP